MRMGTFSIILSSSLYDKDVALFPDTSSIERTLVPVLDQYSTDPSACTYTHHYTCASWPMHRCHSFPIVVLTPKQEEIFVECEIARGASMVTERVTFSLRAVDK